MVNDNLGVEEAGDTSFQTIRKEGCGAAHGPSFSISLVTLCHLNNYYRLPQLLNLGLAMFFKVIIYTRNSKSYKLCLSPYAYVHRHTYTVGFLIILIQS